MALCLRVRKCRRTHDNGGVSLLETMVAVKTVCFTRHVYAFQLSQIRPSGGENVFSIVSTSSNSYVE